MTVDVRFNSRVIRKIDYLEFRYFYAKLGNMTLYRANHIMLTMSSLLVFASAISGAEPVVTSKSLPGVRVLGSSESGQTGLDNDRLQQEADSLWGPLAFGAQVYDSFTSGSNLAFSAGRYMYRKFHSGERDPTFSPDQFIQQHKDVIPFNQQSRWKSAWNENEAMGLLEDYQDSVRKQKLVQMRGSVTGYIAAMTASGLLPIVILVLAFVWRQLWVRASLVRTLSE